MKSFNTVIESPSGIMHPNHPLLGTLELVMMTTRKVGAKALRFTTILSRFIP
jgi:hypothetical protein